VARFAGRSVIVVGAGAVGDGWGNGKAAAVGHARDGARVLCVDRVAQAAGATAALIAAGGHDAPYAYARYEASKAALNRLSRSIALTHAARGIRSNVVLPGVIDTPHAAAFVTGGTDPEATARHRAALVPMGRQGTPWEVA